MKSKVKAFLFRLPAAVLIILVAVLGSYFAKIKNLMPNGMTWAPPIILTILLILYVYGEYLSLKKSQSDS